MHSFLNHKQYVCINGNNSTVKPIQYEVAQGSTLGPLLFLLYINNLSNAVNSIPRLFADDTCLISTTKTLDSLEFMMSTELNN